MKMKRLLSCLLTILLVCSTVLTGCSGNDNSMFTDMKDIARIKTYEFTVQGGISTNADGEDTEISFTMDGKSDGKKTAANMSITWGAITYTLDDFIRMTDNTLYINLSSILSSLSAISGNGDMFSGLKNWVSIPSETSDEAQDLYLDFYDVIIDSLENICKDQDITQSGDTWTLDISGEQMVSFLQTALEEINTNFSSWYDMYVILVEKSGNSELLKDYSQILGKEDGEAATDDPVQALKDGKEDALAAWEENYTAYKELLDDLSESISSGETRISGTCNVSLTGKEGAQNAEQSIEFNLEDGESSESVSMNLSQKITEINDVTVETPDTDDVMTFEEFSEILSSFLSLNGLFDDSEYYEEYTLSEEEMAAVSSSLKDNQVYLYNSYYEDMKPYVLTFDTDLYEIETNVGDYSMDFWIKNTNSYVSLAYDQGNLAEDMEIYYLEEGQKTSTMSTDIGDISYYTAAEVDEWDCYTTMFGIQLDDNSYLVGLLELEETANLDAETCLKSLLKELKIHEGSFFTI